MVCSPFFIARSFTPSRVCRPIRLHLFWCKAAAADKINALPRTGNKAPGQMHPKATDGFLCFAHLRRFLSFLEKLRMILRFQNAKILPGKGIRSNPVTLKIGRRKMAASRPSKQQTEFRQTKNGILTWCLVEYGNVAAPICPFSIRWILTYAHPGRHAFIQMKKRWPMPFATSGHPAGFAPPISRRSPAALAPDSRGASCR